MTVERRLNRIFRPAKGGRALITAMDHGLLDGPCLGLEDPGRTITLVAEGGADAVLTSYGVARRFARELAPLGLILRVDGGGTSLGTGGGPGALFYGVEEALRLGADAVAVSAFPGAPEEMETLKMLAAVIGKAHAWGLPVMAEMVPGGFDSAPEFRTQASIALSVRVAAELGADFVKTPYTDGFEAVTVHLLRSGGHSWGRQARQRARHAGRYQGCRGRRRVRGCHRPQHLPGRRPGRNGRGCVCHPAQRRLGGRGVGHHQRLVTKADFAPAW